MDNFRRPHPVILIMKPILGFAVPKAQQTPKLVLLKVRLWRTFNKTNFYNENC